MRYVLAALVWLTAAPLRTLSAEPISIGGSMSLTGIYAEGGVMQMNAYKLWADKVNKSGGLLGRPVRLMVEDDKSSPEVAAAIYERLITQEKVDLVVGPYSSAMVAGVAPVTERHRYPMVGSAAAESLYQKGYKYLFAVAVNANKYSVSFLELLAIEGVKTVAVVSADDVFSLSVADGAKEWAKRFGLKVVFFEEFAKGAKDLDAVVRAAKASGAEVLMVCGFYDESVAAREALKRVRWQPRAFFATVGPGLQKYRDALKADAEHSFTASQWEPTSAFPGSKEFTESYRRAYGSEPAYQAALGYAGVQILEFAVNKIKSTDRAKVRETLSSLDAITIMGRYGVDQTGRQIRQVAITVQLQNGRKEIVAPKELMTAKAIWSKPAPTRQ